MNGVGGVDRSHEPDRNEADLGRPPNVYHPVGDSRATPAYEAFMDPAAAHGWQNAYDDTVQLDEIVADGPGAVGDGSGGNDSAAGWVSYGEAEAYAMDAPYVEGASYGAGGPGAKGGVGGPEALDVAGRRARPADGRRLTLGRRRARRRGALIAGGVGVAVLVGVAVAGLAGSDPSVQEGPDAPAPLESTPAAARSGDAESASPSAGGSGTGVTASPDTSTQPSSAATSPEPSGPTSPTPTSATSAASPSAPATSSPRGNSNGNQGRGQGATKGPR